MSRLTFGYYPEPVSEEKHKLEKKIFGYSLIIPVIFVIVFILLELAENILGLSFSKLGIYPREVEGLIGILTFSLVHGDWAHLTGNAASFLILSTALFFFYRQLAPRIFIINYFLCGIILWFIGRSNWHIGASGIIYGLAAFLFVSGFLRHDVRLLTIALIVTFLYGSFFWGLFPLKPEISWEGHLAGAFSGFLLAIIYRKQGPPRTKFDWEDEDDEEDDDDDDDDGNNDKLNESEEIDLTIPKQEPENFDPFKLN